MSKFCITISIWFLFSCCTKTSVNPQCWGDCRDATFFYAPCSAITGYLVFKDNPNDTLMITESIPKKFKVDRIEVSVKVKEIDSPIITANCNIKGDNFAKIVCVKEY